LATRIAKITFPAAVAAAAATGGLWFVTTGAVWQFLPIAAAVTVACLVRKRLEKA
jgi:hypothetical protein